MNMPARTGMSARVLRIEKPPRVTQRCVTPGGDQDARLIVNVLALVSLPHFRDEVGVLFRTGFYAHEDAALLDSGFVVLHALFRNAPTHHGADEAARNSARTGTGQRGRYRACDDQ